MAARLYADRLTRFLDWIDRFFGDAGMADRTGLQHAVGLRTPAPLWTAPAFDRCLLLALIYPIVTVFFIWTISGHVGPAEAALHLSPDTPGWRKGVAVLALAVSIILLRYGKLLTGWKRMATIMVGGFLAVFVDIVVGEGAAAAIFSVIAAAAAGSGVGAMALANAVGFGIILNIAVAAISVVVIMGVMIRSREGFSDFPIISILMYYVTILLAFFLLDLAHPRPPGLSVGR
jgi:hypothetical protein